MNDKKITEQNIKKKEERKPNEEAGFYFSGYIKITDPQTGQVLVHTRTE